MTAFADTFALIAWLNPQDEAHAEVAAFLDGFTGQLLINEYSGSPALSFQRYNGCDQKINEADGNQAVPSAKYFSP